MPDCCIKCFSDPYAKQAISAANRTGCCDYCKARNVAISETGTIGRFLAKCVSRAYDSVENHPEFFNFGYEVYWGGSNFRTILEEEGVFSERITLSNNFERLASDLIESSRPSWRETSRGEDDSLWNDDANFVLRYSGIDEDDENETPIPSHTLFSWNKFSEIVKHHSRFFDLDSSAKERSTLLHPIESLFPHLTKTLESDTPIFRCRPIDDNFPARFRATNEIGPPPLQLAGNNRMSPVGISYMYVASNEETSIAEVKPNVGQIVLVGKFKLIRPLRLLDLSSIPQHINSIFGPEYNPYQSRSVWEFLARFQDDISKPYNDKASIIGYIPTQVLSEYIRHSGFDGICYKSCQSPTGRNYALFCGPSVLPSNRINTLPVFTKWMKLTRFNKHRINSVAFNFAPINKLE